MSTPINNMIDASVWCSKCGTPGMFKCDCHVQCSCGWIADKGKPCRNPETRFCSTKKWHTPAHIELRRGERVRLNDEVGFMPCDAKYAGGYFGTVAATPRKRNDVSIRWDGRMSCDRIRISWLEKAE